MNKLKTFVKENKNSILISLGMLLVETLCAFLLANKLTTPLGPLYPQTQVILIKVCLYGMVISAAAALLIDIILSIINKINEYKQFIAVNLAFSMMFNIILFVSMLTINKTFFEIFQ